MNLLVRNRQRARPVNVRLLRWIARSLFQELLQQDDFELGVFLVSAREMTALNRTHLHHAGCTDVITFGYNPAPEAGPGGIPSALYGDIFICVEEAITQARRFRTTWQEEIVRYLVHGGLHLLGYDDATAQERRRMKSKETQCLRELRERFRLASLGGHSGKTVGRTD